MKTQRLALALTVLNLVLFAVLLSQLHPIAAQPSMGMLRGTGLEIVDDQGRRRATISVHGPSVVDGQRYPEAVVFRLIDPNGSPVVKMDASEEGSGLGLSDNSRDGGLRLMAKDRTGIFLQLTSREGRKQVVKP
jgi:hypothetical protein